MKTLDGLEKCLPHISGVFSLKETMMLSFVVALVVVCVVVCLNIALLICVDVATNKYGSKAAWLKKTCQISHFISNTYSDPCLMPK